MKTNTKILTISAIVAVSTGLAYWHLQDTNSSPGKAVENLTQSSNANPNTPVNQQVKTVAKDLSSPSVHSSELMQPSVNSNHTTTNISERIARARETMRSGNMPQKIQALHLLTGIAPAEAAEILRALVIQAKTDPSAAALVSHGMVGLSQSKDYLLDENLKAIFTLSDPNAQKISALILEDRGDSSLVKQYIETKSAGLRSTNPAERMSALEDIASVGFFSAVPYVVNNLRDKDPQVKLNALELLSQFGTNANIASVEPLLSDGNADVKQAAQLTMDALWEKNTNERLSLQERLVQPGFPAQGLVPDLEVNKPTENNMSAVDSNPTNEGT
ncbi:MAG: HEAT repeat domain-containing protein [Pseudomonadota bacterium]